MDDAEKMVVAELIIMRMKGESFFQEMTYHHMFGSGTIPCGQRFKFPKYIGGSVICPKCGFTQDPSRPEIQAAMRAKPID